MENETAPFTLEERQQLYLEGIGMGMQLSEAAEFAGVDRSTAYRWRLDKGFETRVAEARRVCLDKLKAEAERRAMRGSDKLLEFLLCNYAPDQFRRVQHTQQQIQSQSQIKIVSEFDDDGFNSDLV